jgi:hypothetical protein
MSVFKKFREYVEWRGQRGEQRQGVDTSKTGGRPKGRWVSGNMRYGKGGGTGSMKPYLSRETDKRDTRKDIEQGLEKEED